MSQVSTAVRTISHKVASSTNWRIPCGGT